jgi:hypothetical protein
MRLQIAGLAVLLLAGCASGGRAPLPPVGTPLPVPEEAEQDPLAKYPELLRLPGHLVDVSYVPGALDRAAHVQKRLDGMVEALETLVKGRPVTLRAIVLDREGWEGARFERGWGLPARSAPAVLASPAEGDPDTVGRMRALTGGWLPDIPGEVLRGTPEGAASLMVSDALLQLEAANSLREQVGVRGAQPWITALLDHLLARLAWERTDPGGMPAIADLFDRMAVTAQAGVPPRLEDYRADLPLEQAVAWHGAFLRGADLVWVEKGNRGLMRWFVARSRTIAPVTAEDLWKEVPDLARWRAESFAP